MTTNDKYRYELATSIIKTLAEKGRFVHKSLVFNKCKQVHREVMTDVDDRKFSLLYNAALALVADELELLLIKNEALFCLTEKGYKVAKYNSISEYLDNELKEQQYNVWLKRVSAIIQLIVAIFAILGVTVKDFIPEGDKIAIICWIAIGIIIGLGINNLKIWKN